MRLSAKDSAAGRHPHHERTGKLAIGAIAQPCGLGHDLVVCRIHVVSKLDFDAGAQSVCSHTNRCAHDPKFANRCIKTAVLAVLGLQALRGAKSPAEETNVLAEYNHIVVEPHHDIHPISDSLDHGLAGHGSDSRLLALPSQVWWGLCVNTLEHVAD